MVFYEENRRLKNTYLLGEQYGSYFGASLLVIHKSQGGDDILVGAPLYPGDSWDEGCVYYYKNRNDVSTTETTLKYNIVFTIKKTKSTQKVVEWLRMTPLYFPFIRSYKFFEFIMTKKRRKE